MISQNMESRNYLDANRRILIIDDNPAIDEDLRKILAGDDDLEDLQGEEALVFGTSLVQAERFEIDSAFQGKEGLEKVNAALAKGRPYALAFVDVRMPPGWAVSRPSFT